MPNNLSFSFVVSFPSYYYDQYFNSLLGNRRFSNWPSWSSYYHRLCCCRCRCCYEGFGLYCNRSCNHCTACLHIYFFLPSSSRLPSSSNLRRFGFHCLKNSKGLPSLELSNSVSPYMIRSRANGDNLPLHSFESMPLPMSWLLCCCSYCERPQWQRQLGHCCFYRYCCCCCHRNCDYSCHSTTIPTTSDQRLQRRSTAPRSARQIFPCGETDWLLQQHR